MGVKFKMLSTSLHHKNVLAIDPGKSIGVAYVSYLANEGKLEITTKTVFSFEDFFDYFKRIFPDVVVIEDFIGAGPRTKEAIMVLKLIGKIEGICFLLKTPVIIQNPQMRKPYLFKVQKHLKSIVSKHEEDALAHALAYINQQEK